MHIIFRSMNRITADIPNFDMNNSTMPDEPLFHISHKTCVRCYSCVRICPVKAIRVDVNTEFPSILPERCIGCGSCYRACSPHSISYRSSSGQTKELLSSGMPVAAICDPSISGEFHDITDYRKFVEMIRQLGFSYVIEASFGVDLVALISPACVAVSPRSSVTAWPCAVRKLASSVPSLPVEKLVRRRTWSIGS